MNYFSQLFEQARALFMTMTPASRIMSVVMSLAILVSAGFLVRDVQQSDMEFLFGGYVYKESELQLAETAMSNAGLRDYERIGMRIRVPRSERDQYIKALATGGATPQQLGSATHKALTGGNMLESVLMTKARIQEGRQQDLAMALERLPFVDKVYVTYDEKREGFSSQSQSTASVFVLPRHQQPLEEHQKRSIIHQVKAAFAGLKYENISVMDMSSGMSMPGSSDPMTGEQQRYYQYKMSEERRLREKALNLLADYGDVKVEANVELDTTLREETEVLKYHDKPVTIETTTSKKDAESSRPLTGGRPGTEPNAIANRSQTLAGGNEQTSKSKEQQESERKIVGQETTLSEKTGLVVKSATLSVAIPFSYYSIAHKRQWPDLNPGVAYEPLTAKTLEDFKKDIRTKIEVSLASILPEPPAGVSARPKVTVTDYLDLPVEALPGPSIATTAGGWLATNWQSLMMGGIALLALFSLRSFVASGGRPRDDEAFERGFDLPVDAGLDAELNSLQAGGIDLASVGNETNAEATDEDSEENPLRKRFRTAGGEVRTELTELVRENPDMAATLLRTWIGEAA